MKKTVLISKLLVALLLAGNIAGAAPAAASYYTVRTGDTVFGISKRHGLKYHNILAANNLNNSTIYPGQKLILPKAAVTEFYYVRPGDNLFRIARRFGLKLTDVMAVNGLKTTGIRAGDRLRLPARKSRAVPVFGDSTVKRYTEDDVALLAKLIHAEARGEGHLGKVAVGAVIMNRITSGEFPTSIRDVIYQKTKGVYQFTPVKDGNINRHPGEEAYRAAREAIRGTDPTGGALFFYNPEKSSDRWIRTLPVTTKIGNHVFAK